MIRRGFVAALVSGMAYLAWHIVAALNTGSIFTAGSRIAAEPWGFVTLIDLYLGFVAVGGLVVWREQSLRRAWPWLAGLLLLGNLATALYVIRWLSTDGQDGDARR